MPERRLFTLQEAEALLPSLREHLAEMQACKRQVDAIRDALENAVSSTAGNGHVRDEAALAEKRRQAEALVEDINARLKVMTDWGVELKGLDEGLIDFPSERDGRVVYLCWKLGEAAISWWHETNTGFNSRQLL